MAYRLLWVKRNASRGQSDLSCGAAPLVCEKYREIKIDEPRDESRIASPSPGMDFFSHMQQKEEHIRRVVMLEQDLRRTWIDRSSGSNFSPPPPSAAPTEAYREPMEGAARRRSTKTTRRSTIVRQASIGVAHGNFGSVREALETEQMHKRADILSESLEMFDVMRYVYFFDTSFEKSLDTTKQRPAIVAESPTSIDRFTERDLAMRTAGKRLCIAFVQEFQERAFMAREEVRDWGILCACSDPARSYFSRRSGVYHASKLFIDEWVEQAELSFATHRAFLRTLHLTMHAAAVALYSKLRAELLLETHYTLPALLRRERVERSRLLAFFHPTFFKPSTHLARERFDAWSKFTAQRQAKHTQRLIVGQLFAQRSLDLLRRYNSIWLCACERERTLSKLGRIALAASDRLLARSLATWRLLESKRAKRRRARFAAIALRNRTMYQFLLRYYFMLARRAKHYPRTSAVWTLADYHKRALLQRYFFTLRLVRRHRLAAAEKVLRSKQFLVMQLEQKNMRLHLAESWNIWRHLLLPQELVKVVITSALAIRDDQLSMEVVREEMMVMRGGLL